MKLNKTEMENYRKYHIPGCSNINTLKLDAVFFNTHNSEKHELFKAKVCWEIKRDGGHFICEAERNRKKGEDIRRIDVVNLTSSDEIEIETDHSIKKSGSLTIYI